MAGFIPFIATKIQNAIGAPVNGMLAIQPTDASDYPIVAVAGGGGVMVPALVEVAVVNGIAAPCIIADTTQTTPPNISYRLTLRDKNGLLLLRFTGVQTSGMDFDLDTYAQGGAATYGGGAHVVFTAPLVLVDTVDATHQLVTVTNGVLGNGATAASYTAVAAIYLIDAGDGHHYQLTSAYDSTTGLNELTLALDVSGSPAVTGYGLQDTATGAAWTLTSFNGQITVA